MSTAASIACYKMKPYLGSFSTWLHAKQYSKWALISDCSANLPLVLLSVAQALGSLIGHLDVQEGSLHDKKTSELVLACEKGFVAT